MRVRPRPPLALVLAMATLVAAGAVTGAGVGVALAADPPVAPIKGAPPPGEVLAIPAWFAYWGLGAAATALAALVGTIKFLYSALAAKDSAHDLAIQAKDAQHREEMQQRRVEQEKLLREQQEILREVLFSTGANTTTMKDFAQAVQALDRRVESLEKRIEQFLSRHP